MKNMQATRMTARRAKGFSLVEVLIAIFVLALGLLGLAAVFPAVVRQQRAASDSVQGISMQRSVEELLRGNALLAATNEQSADGRVTTPRGWAMLARDPEFSRLGTWGEVNEAASASASGITIDPRTGAMFVGFDGVASGAEAIELPLADRLIPRPSLAGQVQPRFVWDFVARRVAAGRNPASPGDNDVERLDDDTIQLAVFVRRIDQSIRVPAGSSLGEVLARLNPPPPVVPVAEDVRGRPTFDGVGGDNAPRYSPIRSGRARVVINPEDPRGLDVISMELMAEDLRPYLEQLGQKFVDAKGVVHEVVRVDREGRDAARLTVTPPFAPSLVFDGATRQDPVVLYTPQVPASVSVMSIRR